MNALTRFERFDDMFPEMVRRFMRPTQMNLDAPGEIRVAKYEDGVLKLTLPKRKEASSKTLAIQ